MKTYLNANEYKDDEGNTYREYYTGNGTDWTPLFCMKEVEETTVAEAEKKKDRDTTVRDALNACFTNSAMTLCLGKGNWVPEITRVIFNYPATIVFWADGTKTVVKMQNSWLENDDPEKGLAMAVAKKALGNAGSYYNVFKKWLKEGGYYD